MEKKIEKIDLILKSLFNTVKMGNPINSKIIYSFLINYGISDTERGYVNSNYFDKWVERFKDRANISVVNSSNMKYFCKFNNGHINYDCIKMYIPLDKEHIYEGVNQLFGFMADNNIVHMSKVSSNIRIDDVVIRVNDLKDAKKIQEFVSNNPYLSEGMISGSAFCFNDNGIGYSYDGTISYNYCVAEAINSYIDNRVRNGYVVDNINSLDFSSYIDDLSNNRDEINNYKYASFYDGVAYYRLVLNLLKLNLSCNDIGKYFEYVDKCRDLSKGELNYNFNIGVFGEKKIISDKEELFKELILTTMKKYPKGHDIRYPYRSGFDYIYTYLSGNLNGVTRDNNLREKVKNNLSVDDIYDIVDGSGILGNSLDDKVHNYIKKVMLDEVIRCMEIRLGDRALYNIDMFTRSNRLGLITEKVGNARNLVRSMNGYDICDFLYLMGTLNIYEYFSKYYSKHDDRKKVR